jgi:hypothetical protein
VLAFPAVGTLEPIILDFSLGGKGRSGNDRLLAERASGAGLAEEAVTAIDRRQSVKLDAVTNDSAAAAPFETHAAF